jgi:hypothetical protein
MNAKEDPAIESFDPERVIPEAKGGDTEALRLLLISMWLRRLLNTVSGRVARRFKVDAEELWDFLFETIRKGIDTLDNPNNIPWGVRLTRRCYTVAKNRAKNVIRHRVVEEHHWDDVAHENTSRITDGMRTARLRSHSMTPEEELLRKEQDARVPAIRMAARAAFRSLTPKDKQIITLWLRGRTLEEIFAATGTPVATASYRITRFTKPVVKALMEAAGEENRAAELMGRLKVHRDGICQLIANSLAGADLRGDGARAGA